MTHCDPETVTLVRCERVARTYGSGTGSTVGLAGVDLQLDAGEVLAVVGPSGCGKSTLLHLLGAMDRPDRGRVLFENRDLASLNDRDASRFRREEVGFVFQFFNLIPTLSVTDNIALPARLAGQGVATARERATELLRRVNLTEKAKEYPDSLSGGQQQRVAIARALVNEPRLILADEPTGALDVHSGADVLALLLEVVRERRTTLVMATHSESASAHADRRLRLRDGRVESIEQRSGTPPG